MNFKELTTLEKLDFKEWAEKHWTEEIKSIYHPVVQEEMKRLKLQATACLDSEITVTIECHSCSDVADYEVSELDEESELQALAYFLDKGWRYASSAAYASVAFVCPECFDDKDEDWKECAP